jgi:hypothetical protein
MAKKVRVYVYKETKLIDEYRVYPGVVVLEKNDELELVNVSGDEATWEVPAGPFTAQPSSDPVANKHGKTKTVLANADAQAVEYVVKVNGKKAHGNSDPVIIIDL